MESALISADSGSQIDARGMRFFALLAVVTALPLVTLPLLSIGRGDPGYYPVGAWIVLTGYVHIASTFWFGVDRDYHDLARQHRHRAITALIVIPMLFACVGIASQGAFAVVFAGYLVWQAHHFNRQNYGIMALAAKFDGSGALPREIGWIVNLTTVAGAVQMATLPLIYPHRGAHAFFLSDALGDGARTIAIAAFVVAFAIAGLTLVRSPALRRSPTVLVFLALTLGFYLPTLGRGNDWAVFWPYAGAHGGQYLCLVALTAARSGRSLSAVAGFVVGLIALGGLAAAMSRTPFVEFYTGIVVWHFIVDARLWRLRDPAVRAIVARRFDFIFERPSRA